MAYYVNMINTREDGPVKGVATVSPTKTNFEAFFLNDTSLSPNTTVSFRDTEHFG